MKSFLKKTIVGGAVLGALLGASSVYATTPYQYELTVNPDVGSPYTSYLDADSNMPNAGYIFGTNPETNEPALIQVGYGLQSTGALLKVSNVAMSDVAGLTSNLTALDTNKASTSSVASLAATVSGLGTGQIQSDWTQSSTTAKDYIKNKPIFESYATTTDASGNFTWTFFPSYTSAPVVTAIVQTGTTTSSFNVQLVSRTTTQAVFKVYSTVPTNVLGSLLGAAPVATQATINVMAIGN